MKVLYLEDTVTSAFGGQERSMLETCQQLDELGQDVTLGYTTPGDLLGSYHELGIKTVQLSPYTIDRRAILPNAARWMRGLTRAARISTDVIGLNAYYSSLFGGVLAKLKRVPLVCHLRLFPPVGICWQWRVMLPRVTRFIAVSSAVRDAFIDFGVAPGIIDVVYNGVDMSWYRPRDNRDAVRDSLGIPRDAFVVIFVGRIDREKNVEDLLRTFAALGRPAASARLLVVGRPVVEPESYLAELKALASSLGIGSSVHWLGSRLDVPELFSASDVSVLGRVPGRSPEPLARTTYEAMACGIPSIAARRGGTPEVLNGEFARFAFDDRTTEQATSILRSLIGWQERDPSLGERARAHVLTRFGLEDMGRATLRSLDQARVDFVHAQRLPRPVYKSAPSPVTESP